MKKSLIILLLQFSLLGLYSQKQTNSIDSSFESLVTKYGNRGVSAAYSVEGKIEWVASKGYSNMESNTNFAKNTLTRIASITKPMTAICIMQLLEKLIYREQKLKTKK